MAMTTRTPIFNPRCQLDRFSPHVTLALALLLGLQAATAAERPIHREWKVGGITREALIHVPAGATTHAAPVVFVFHGHGGSARNTYRKFHIHTLWPGAIVVYPQGLKTPGALTDPEGKRAGWQHRIGDHGDRDLRFFDSMLRSLSTDYDVGAVFVTGHSNGGGFTYLLWAARGDQLTALAPSAAAGFRHLRLLKPKPVLHIAGEKDQLVRFVWQKRMMDGVRRLNQCGEGRPWKGHAGCTLYESALDMPVITFIHPGAHGFPSEAPELIVQFFQDQWAKVEVDPAQDHE